MKDVLAIDKAKNALIEIMEVPGICDYAPLGVWEKAEEAIAALEAEKPVDDVELDDAVSDMLTCAYDWSVDCDYIGKIIQQYAEHYHAKKREE